MIKKNKNSVVQLTVADLKQSHATAKSLIELLIDNPNQGGVVLGLSGPLGAGKTEFVRGIAQALGIGEQVTSPTFVLENIYTLLVPQGSIKIIHHWDLYRLNADFRDQGLIDAIGSPGELVIVEWPEKVPWVKDLLSLQIEIDFMPDFSSKNEGQRQITFSASKIKGLLEKLAELKTVSS